jgi:hypothetical protein
MTALVKTDGHVQAGGKAPEDWRSLRRWRVLGNTRPRFAFWTAPVLWRFRTAANAWITKFDRTQT